MFKTADITTLLKRNSISLLDFHFARFMERLSGGENSELALAAALVSHHTRKGHVCLDLVDIAGKPFSTKGEKSPLPCPELSAWMATLEGCGVVGKPGDFAPLIIDKSRLYLHRYRAYEEQVRDFILKRVSSGLEDIRFELLGNGLQRLFPEKEPGITDWQMVAAFTSLAKRFCVVSGGPGTGKTTTIVKILALLLEQSETNKNRIALAAPTGKAAARLEESVAKEKGRLHCAVKELIPEGVSTLHRLLGAIPHSPYFRYHAQNLLPVDVLVVDEVSLVDLPMMAKLTQALNSKCRVILLGDSDQLASVAPGAVLGDICGRGENHWFSDEFAKKLRSVAGAEIPKEPPEGKPSGLRDCIIRLRRNFRFGSESGIGTLGVAVKEGKAEEALGILKDDRRDIIRRELPLGGDLSRPLGERIIEDFKDYLETNDPVRAFERFGRFRVLCALRGGPRGVAAVNRLAETVLAQAGLIAPDKDWYRGRPVMVTRNDYNLNLFNGDIGIILPDIEGNNQLRAFFPGPGNTFEKFLPQILPEHETVFAMTVHKSQGSEFDKVLVLLPDTPSPVLTRELIYTGITRARKSVEIWGKEEVFLQAVKSRVERTSGLREALLTNTHSKSPSSPKLGMDANISAS